MGDDRSAEKVAREVLDALHEGCQVIGFDYTYLYVNEAVAAQGRSTPAALLGRKMTEAYPGIDKTPMFAVLERCMRERRADRMENEFDYPSGGKGWFELRFLPVPDGLCILSLDITGQKLASAALERSEAQLRQAQKMEAVGQLAGGVAHDFNNLLSIILSYASIAAGRLAPGAPGREELLEIKKAGERAAALTRQLLTFSRKGLMRASVLDLNAVILDMDKMLRRLMGASVALRTIAGSDLWKIKADKNSVEQVLMNLVVNARDAMPKGGTVTVETQNVELDAAFAASHLGARAGPHVMLAVSDTGVGIDKATQERIFEPFFTTKERGKGTGLGLSTVFGIAQQCGGTVWVYSEVGKGTTFKVYFPRTDGAVAPAPETPPAAAPRATTGSETVLLVEDEPQLRAVARGILSSSGYQVLDAGSGGEALELCERHDGPIHLLLTDVVMPGMGGRELAERLVKLRPAMRVLFMSGYTEDAILQHGALESGVPLLQKPITPDALLQRTRELLDLGR